MTKLIAEIGTFGEVALPRIPKTIAGAVSGRWPVDHFTDTELMKYAQAYGRALIASKSQLHIGDQIDAQSEKAETGAGG